MKAALQTKDVLDAIDADKKLRHKMMLSLTRYKPWMRHTKRRSRMTMGERLKQLVVGDGLLTKRFDFSHIPWDKLALQIVVQERTEMLMKKLVAHTQRFRTK